MIPAIGFRTAFSWDETAKFLGISKTQLKGLVQGNHITKAGEGLFPFLQKDVNAFLVRLNAGKVRIGNRRKSA